MNSEILNSLFLILLLALMGGFAAKALKLPILVGYILAGVFVHLLLPVNVEETMHLAEIGLILLLFSVGLELSFSRFTETGLVVVFGAVAQLIIVAIASFFALSLLGIGQTEAIILSMGFTLSSTALVVKILEDRGETEAIHGRLMISWLLTQDLAVIVIFTLLTIITKSSGSFLLASIESLAVSLSLLSAVYLLGRLLVPYVIHKIAATNTRELLILSSVSLALGTAFLVSLFGISGALGAFIAGLVISESQENHAIFSETRPLRDIFVILFFATLGFIVNPTVLKEHILLILGLFMFVNFIKAVVVYVITLLLGYRGKTVWSLAFGLSQIGEFSFVIFLSAQEMGLISPETTSVGISVGLLSLIATPFMFKLIVPAWRAFSNQKANPKKIIKKKNDFMFKDHVVICGYGRVGSWVGRALSQAQIKFAIIDYNQSIIEHAKAHKIPAVFGDPAEIEILINAGAANAKAVIITIPDLITQEEVATHMTSLNPTVPVIARAHRDQDYITLRGMVNYKVVQPEFEGALAIVKEIYTVFNKKPSAIKQETTKLRRLHTMTSK